MGKGSRNSRQRMNEQLAQEEKLLAKEKAKKSKKNADRWIAITCIVIAVLVVAILVLNVLGETGVFLRAQKAMYIDGNSDVTVNAAMMTFFVNDQITSWYNNYYVYVAYGLIGLDLSHDIREQTISTTDASYLGDSEAAGKTWYNYFMDMTLENVEMYITYASKANDAGIGLDDEDLKEIDETVNSIKETLKQSNMSIADQYGKGVKERDIRNCYKLIQLAANYAEHLQEEFKDKHEKNDSDVLAYPEENKSDFYSAKYLSYSISVSEKTEGTQEKYDQAVANAKAAAEKIAEAKTPADFAKLVELYKKSPSAFLTDGEPAEADAETESSTEEATEKETTEEELVDKYTSSMEYQTSDEIGKWIFESAEENDVKIVEETSTEVVTVKETDAESEAETEAESGETDDDGKITYEKYKVTVYMLKDEPSMDLSLTHNMAYLVSDNKEAAEAFLKSFLESDEKNREKFETLADDQYKKLHNVNEHGEHEHEDGETEPVFSFANVDKAKEAYFATDYHAINEWLDSADRKDGDYTAELIEITVKNNDTAGTTTTYYAAVFFENHDDAAWYVDAFNGVVQKEIDDWYQAELDKKLISYNLDLIYDLDIIGG